MERTPINLAEKFSRFTEHWSPIAVEHKTSAAAECRAMLVELAGTVNTGDAVSDQTAPSDAWI